MVYYLDMPFEKEEDIPDFGSIAMYFVGLPQLGYHEYNNKKFRKYVLDSVDITKLNLINNAIDGSQAEILDTGDKYILCENQWIKQPTTSSGGSGDVTKSYVDSAIAQCVKKNEEVILTQEEYDALTSKDANMYFIIEED